MNVPSVYAIFSSRGNLYPTLPDEYHTSYSTVGAGVCCRFEVGNLQKHIFKEQDQRPRTLLYSIEGLYLTTIASMSIINITGDHS